MVVPPLGHSLINSSGTALLGLLGRLCWSGWRRRLAVKELDRGFTRGPVPAQLGSGD